MRDNRPNLYVWFLLIVGRAFETYHFFPYGNFPMIFNAVCILNSERSSSFLSLARAQFSVWNSSERSRCNRFLREIIRRLCLVIRKPGLKICGFENNSELLHRDNVFLRSDAKIDFCAMRLQMHVSHYALIRYVFAYVYTHFKFHE